MFYTKLNYIQNIFCLIGALALVQFTWLQYFTTVMADTDIKIISAMKYIKGANKLWGSGFHPKSKKPPEQLLHRSDMLFNEQVNTNI